MSLDLSKLLESQRRLTGAIESLVTVVSAQNMKIAALTAAASAPAATSPEDQAAVDAAAADLAAVADRAETAAPPPTTGL